MKDTRTKDLQNQEDQKDGGHLSMPDFSPGLERKLRVMGQFDFSGPAYNCCPAKISGKDNKQCKLTWAGERNSKHYFHQKNPMLLFTLLLGKETNCLKNSDYQPSDYLTISFI